MQYWIYIKNRRTGFCRLVEESFLPGIRIPVRIEELLTAKWVEQNFPDWCRHCEMDERPHPIRPDGSKFCTILFHDAIKPGWKLEEVV
jgi:hypothetical protein